MNAKTHTVTIPIEDYQELMASHNAAEQKFAAMRHKLISRLVDIKINHVELKGLVSQVIKVIEDTQ